MSQVMTCYRHPNRETRLSCSECGRPICTECMTMAPVGLRCPDHSGKPRGAAKVTSGVRRWSFESTGSLVTKALIAINVLVYLLEIADGGSVNGPGVDFQVRWALYGPAVAQGDWYRLITSGFLHANLLHIGLNMLILWLVGSQIEEVLGRGRYLLLYLVSLLAGSAGALLQSPFGYTLGASGAIFGLFGALLVLEYFATGQIVGSQAFGLIVINLIFSFYFGGISWGGHIGGLVGGILGTLALAQFRRAHPGYTRLGLASVAGLLLVGAASVAVAYWKVRGYA
ncbi:MAG TPA: rhomboid family intramembrane serine protease [Gaiellaceae bacterium]